MISNLKHVSIGWMECGETKLIENVKCSEIYFMLLGRNVSMKMYSTQKSCKLTHICRHVVMETAQHC